MCGRPGAYRLNLSYFMGLCRSGNYRDLLGTEPEDMEERGKLHRFIAFCNWSVKGE